MSRGRARTVVAAILLALPLLSGCASLGAVTTPDAADAVRLDRADVACYHGATFR